MTRNPEVHRWLDATAHPLDATLRRTREIIVGADDRVTPTLEAGRDELEAVIRAWCD